MCLVWFSWSIFFSFLFSTLPISVPSLWVSITVAELALRNLLLYLFSIGRLRRKPRYSFSFVGMLVIALKSGFLSKLLNYVLVCVNVVLLDKIVRDNALPEDLNPSIGCAAR